MTYAQVLRYLRRSILVLGLFGSGFVFVCFSLVQRASTYIVPAGDIAPAPVGIVLGAKVQANGQPSDVLRDRLVTAADLYHRGIVQKVLLSGDNGQVEYDEVNDMRVFMLGAGIPPEDIFLDHAGFDTYDSMVRAREVFGITSAIVVTQQFHLPRALFLARSQGMTAYGVVADRQRYLGIVQLRLREIPASVKAWINVLFAAEPTYLGNSIDITGDGRVTWDEDANILDETE